MFRRDVLAVIPCVLASAASAQVVNGGFDAGTDGWSIFRVDGAGGWRSTGGHPGGFFILNDNGDTLTDPAISQTLTGLTIGTRYAITGDFINAYGIAGSSALSFGVVVDDTVILQLGDPGHEWTPFSAEFVATSDTHTIRLTSERNGTDTAQAIDNIALSVVPTPGAATLAIGGLLLANRRRR